MNQDIRKNENLLDLRTPIKKLGAKNPKKSYVWYFIGVVLGFVLVLLAVFMYGKVTHKENLDNVIVIKNKIAKHVVLPKDEEPALVTIVDKNKVTTPFLKIAENGDKVLIYQKAKRVIVYRPSIDRILDIGPVSIATPANP